ncbi:methyltransferase [Homarus gammarus nudivirus]|uniref:Methyltransferase n=1 Tax=Homarus gammarus nudivirus TaxID=2509616 RepID=A0A411HB47_9VIRU|nr:methyltransferase [Homarus gammarus nudivirus]QBB28607.1 methyltransferase [Homarus gammarus nudivirus]
MQLSQLKQRVRSRNYRVPTPEQLRHCGFHPNKFATKVTYGFKYHVMANITLKPDDVYQLPTNTSIQGDILDKLLQSTTTNYNRGYDKQTVINYDEVRSPIEKNTLQKNMMGKKPEEIIAKNRDLVNPFCYKLFPHWFLNRASMKLSNLNYSFDNIIGKLLSDTNKKVSFADLCCAPGGFSYYLMNTFCRKYMDIYMTTMENVGTYLKISPKVEQLQCKSNVCISFGDICSKDNRLCFKNIVGSENTLDFVLADGGIDFSGNENHQEFMSRKLYLSQMIMGLDLLKPTGFMICKFFDLYSTFSITLLFLLSFLFEEIKICKPMTSRQGNSEKYILFKKYKPNCKIITHMKEVLDTELSFDMYKLHMINSLVNIEEAYRFGFAQFLDDITEINKKLAMKQFIALQKYNGVVKIIQHHMNLEHDYMKMWHSTIKR